ncbi:MAG: protein kinase [Planctomycetia bacterium]|nr:protein kinase [Planctomycetia bacterium]
MVKLLKNDTQKTRLRMHQEATNLGVVHGAGGLVPRVLGHNTERYGEPEIPLFLAMEFISGPGLSEHVTPERPMDFAGAVPFALRVAETLKKGHEFNVLHRDLKPDNIIVRDGVPFIVDYGLSFNKDEDRSLTSVDEPIKNSFIDLPETHHASGDRHRPESDVTALCGILYYCLTALRVGPLLDERGLAPHRREHFLKQLQISVPDEAARAHLDSFFSKGLANEIERRFQRIDDAIGRLEAMRVGAVAAPAESVSELAERLRKETFGKSRKVRLITYTRLAQEYAANLRPVGAKYGDLGKAGFHVGDTGYNLRKIQLPPLPDGLTDYDRLLAVGFDIRLEGADMWRTCAYRVVNDGEESVVLRVDLQQRHGSQPEITPTWKAVYRYPADQVGSVKVIAADFDAFLKDAMITLAESV